MIPSPVLIVTLSLIFSHEKTAPAQRKSLNNTMTSIFRPHFLNFSSLPINNQEIVEIIFARFMNNNYSIYDDIIHSFKDVLKGQDFD